MDSKEAINKYKKHLDTDTYTLTGEMDIVSNEEVYHYNVNVDYKEGDYYKVSLINKNTTNEQIILKNNNGVYVVTPALNKSYKFQSEWPYNSSQVYILSSLLNDLENDSNVVLEEMEEEYSLTSTVNYPNNSELISQKIIFDKDMIPKLVEVYNKEGISCITLKISKIEFDNDFDENHFEVSKIEVTDEENVSNIDEIIYPMYLPVGTKFNSEEKISEDGTQRVILSFTGDKSFILIEEVSNLKKEHEVTNTEGELVFYENIVGDLKESSLSWTMDGKDYYLIAENLTNEEMLKVASSTSVVSSLK